MTESEFIEGLLSELGDNAEDIANSLEALGIKGITMVPSACPITNYLRSTTGDDKLCTGSLWVMRMADNYVDDGEYLDDDYYAMEWKVDLPEAVRAFINLFDGEGYPQLILDTENHTP